jgi:hypothetical protein
MEGMTSGQHVFLIPWVALPKFHAEQLVNCFLRMQQRTVDDKVIVLLY